jgi:hypothetical protein
MMRSEMSGLLISDLELELLVIDRRASPARPKGGYRGSLQEGGDLNYLDSAG